MNNSKLKKTITMINSVIIDELISKLSNCNILGYTKEEIDKSIEIIQSIKKAEDPIAKNKKSIKEHLKCTRTTKLGSPCNAPKSNEISCWSHMTQEEKAKHNNDNKSKKDEKSLKEKVLNKKKSKKEEILKITKAKLLELENLANE